MHILLEFVLLAHSGSLIESFEVLRFWGIVHLLWSYSLCFELLHMSPRATTHRGSQLKVVLMSARAAHSNAVNTWVNRCTRSWNWESSLGYPYVRENTELVKHVHSIGYTCTRYTYHPAILTPVRVYSEPRSTATQLYAPAAGIFQ